MAFLVQSLSKRAVKKFLSAEGLQPLQICTEMQAMYENVFKNGKEGAA